MNIRDLLTIGSFLFLIGVSLQGRFTDPSYEPLRLPDGRAFPASQKSLLQMRDHPNRRSVQKMRAHAWDIFAGLTNGEDPIWDTWYTKCDVHLEVKGCAASPSDRTSHRQRQLQNFEIPTQSLRQFEGLSAAPAASNPQTPGLASQASPLQLALLIFLKNFREHPQFASVLFNREAANNIVDNCLYPRANYTKPSASGACPNPLAAPAKIAPFDRTSVVLKTSWELIHPTPGTNLAGPLTTWNPDLWNQVHPENTDPLTFMKNTLMINTTPGLICKNRDYPDGESVPLSCFFYYKLTADDIKAIPETLVDIDDNAFHPGDLVVLVAVHVATKEIDDWVWATFWWDNHSVSDSYRRGRPPSIKRRWSHFLMDTTLSGTTPIAGDGGPKICFNPYLETRIIPNGIISNCLECHRNAAYGSTDAGVDLYGLGILSRNGKTLANGQSAIPGYFDHRVSTDFLWSLASGEDPALQEVLKSLHELATTPSLDDQTHKHFFFGPVH
jgi:hypothetical protein